MSGRRRGSRVRKTRTALDAFLDISLILSTTPSSRSRPKSTRGRRKTTRSRPSNSSTSSTAPMEIVDLDESWPPSSSSHIMENVNTKVDEFMVSGGFISSDDDDDVELTKTKPSVKPEAASISIFSDSDDDIQLSKIATNTKPGTSSEMGAGTPIKNSNAVENPDDDIIQLVDSVLDKPEDNLEQLENYRQETEDMLNNVASFLDKIKSSDKKPEPVVTPKDSKKPDETAVPTCPICLEVLSSKAAAVTLCGHMFCKECITQAAKSKKCPTCRKGITAKKIHPVYF